MSGKDFSRRELARVQARRWTAQVAERVLAAQEASGETVTGFARQQGLSPQRLLWWRSRLGEWREGAGSRDAPGLVPAVVAMDRPASGDEGPQVKLRMGALTVEVVNASAVPPGWLAALVRELGAAK